jgi:uncharacterized protein (DUF1778 family)
MQSNKSSKKSSDHPKTIRFGTAACVDTIRKAARAADISFNKFVVRAAKKAAEAPATESK